MRKYFTLFAILLLTVFQGISQDNVNYQRDSRWFIGLNAGATWTSQTEVPYRIRGGYGLTFGKSYGMEPNKMFSWDIRARFLHAQIMGQATNRYNLDSTSTVGLENYEDSPLKTYQDSLGYFIPNYQTNLLKGSIELVLNTNRWRQRTGWNLYAFGGIGITGYHTASDMLNEETGGIYNYETLGSASQNGVLNFQDGDYETDLVGNFAEYEIDWMPSFGVGLSKQIHPAVAIGIEHKTTWTRTNLFDGMPNTNAGVAAELNDRYHYTGLTLKFHLFNPKSRVYDDEEVEEPVNIDDFDQKEDPIVNEPVTRKKPIVDIFDPSSSPFTTTENTFRLKANVHYVENKSNITFKQDGNLNNNFSYNASTDKFESVVVLHPGQNLFEITGTNEAGSDYEAVIIVYQEEEEPINPPIVTITNPPSTPYVTNSNVFGLVSTVLNVESKAQIDIYLNGVNLNVFNYNLSTKVLNAPLNLIEGTNTVTVSATNVAGSDSKTVHIIYEKPAQIQPPIVSFTNPSENPHYTTVSLLGVRANALHVATKEDLTIKLNGNDVTSYTFNTSTKEIYFNISLIEGANFVEITGVNAAGSDYASTTIIYTKPETPRPPIVNFTDPIENPITVYTSSYNVSAKVEYVNSAEDITLKINGVETELFTYSTSSDLMNFTTSLVEGSNVIEVKGVNGYGSDIATTTIIYKRTIPQAPPIVNITYPGIDNMVFGTPNVNLVASVLNVTDESNITVNVNGVPTLSFTYNSYTKILNLPLVLNEGSNNVSITGTNAVGSDTKTRFIIYEKPVNPTPPTVAFINPSTSPYLAATATYTVTANTTNIDAKSQIVFKQNGELIPDAAYSFVGGHQIVYNASLIAGSNIFEVSVENGDGADEDLAVINYVVNENPCVIPTVGYISPVPYSTVDEPNVTIDAQINNHSAETIVELKLNGVSKGYMSYNPATSIASKGVTLLEGSNAITVIVTNDCGTNQATFTLNYDAPDAPCYEPSLTAAGPSIITTEEELINLSLSSSHITAKDEVVVQLNGVIVDFAFDAGTGSVILNELPLALGSNSVVVTATTECGSAIKIFTIQREVCDIPVISAVSPVSGSVVDEESIIFSANVSEVSSEEISVLLNGVSQAFTYNEATGVLTLGATINTGLNSIIVRAENACGSAERIINITREIPCESIVTNLLTPSLNVFTATEENINISLNATGLTSVEQISVTNNGVTVPVTFDPITGNITINDLNLVDGANAIQVHLTNDCSKSLVTYDITYNGCEPPVIIINEIWPGKVVSEDIFELNVVVTNISSGDDIVVKLNGEVIDFDFNPASHLLSANLSLMEGANSIEVTANGCETINQSASLTYEVPCTVISHSLLIPASTNITAVEESYSVSLSVVGIESTEEIEVKLNGVIHPFVYNSESQIISIAGIALVDGVNALVVKLTNECSSDIINYTINYDGCVEPVITLGVMPSVITTPNFNLEANVQHVSADQIQVLFNGVPADFVYDPSTGAIDAELTLSEGENSIEIIANSCELVKVSTDLTYTVPCEPLVYTLTNPEGLSTSSAEAIYNISLLVQHVSEEGIAVRKDGDLIDFSLTDNLLSINGINLVDGANIITVELANDCSSETIKYTIKHDDCTAPKINLSANPLSSEVSTYNFTANIAEVENAAKIEVFVNGVSKPFSYNAVTRNLTATFTLIEGVNTIEVVANGCEKAVKKLKVNYAKPCVPVTYSLVSPTNLTSDIDEATTAVRINTGHVNPETVKAFVNGEEVSAIFSEGVIDVPEFSLIEGSNNVMINFANECSKESIIFSLNHNPCETPSIVINGLTDGTELSEESLVFFASLFNVADAGDITLKLNGLSVPFEFNSETHLLQAALTLNEGSNEIQIAVNGCEIVSEELELILNPPCLAPTYSLIAPTESSVEVEGDSYTVSVAVGNVSEDQITVKVNGGTTEFTYSAGTVFVEVPYISVPTNAVEVVLTNDCGSAEVDFLITYVVKEEDCNPEISVSFADDHKNVDVTSNKEITNVILNLNNGTTMVVEDIDEFTGSFEPIGTSLGACIVGVWVRSGCNVGAAGEPYGEYFPNPKWDGICGETNPCLPITYTLITPARLSVSTAVSPYNIVLNTSNVKDKENIKAVFNGKVVDVDFAGDQITLSGLTLIKGMNSLQFVLTNDCSSETITYMITYSQPIMPGGPNGGTVGNKVNQQNNENDPGDNKMFQAQPAPVITPISPSSNKSTVKTETFNLKAKVENVSSKSNITMYVNGSKYASFVYSSNTNQLSAILKLKNGVNLVKIEANNGNKVDYTYYITYQASVQNKVQNVGNPGGTNQQIKQQSLTPKLQRITPSSSVASTDNSSYLLKLKALNVASKSGLTLNVNGVNVTNFTFSSSTKIMSAVLRLKEGKNTIRVNAVNGDKKAALTYSITYKKVVQKVTLPQGNKGGGSENKVVKQTVKRPVITKVAPSSSSTTVKTNTYVVKAKLTNVNAKNDITFTVNGTKSTAFTYNAQTGEFIATVDLKAGANSVRISAKNGNLSATTSYKITYELAQVAKPVGGGIQQNKQGSGQQVGGFRRN